MRAQWKRAIFSRLIRSNELLFSIYNNFNIYNDIYSIQGFMFNVYNYVATNTLAVLSFNFILYAFYIIFYSYSYLFHSIHCKISI